MRGDGPREFPRQGAGTISTLLVGSARLGTVVLLLIPAAGSLAGSTLLLAFRGLGTGVSRSPPGTGCQPIALGVHRGSRRAFTGSRRAAARRGPCPCRPAGPAGRAADVLGPTAVLRVRGGLPLPALPAAVRAVRPGTGATRRPDPAGPQSPDEQT
ncbi:putative sugar efflux transporter [Streptomyces azureus]|uniref:Putative sugar efflux transporter n=1 Tax=Streptomyces azureus TaxID=146537 RepID=A0A0K8PR89_STRAJ|nr:putative sugar efflux transporter [Streptomyces azureus]